MDEYTRITVAKLDGLCKHDADETCYYCAPAVSPVELGRW